MKNYIKADDLISELFALLLNGLPIRKMTIIASQCTFSVEGKCDLVDGTVNYCAIRYLDNDFVIALFISDYSFFFLFYKS